MAAAQYIFFIENQSQKLGNVFSVIAGVSTKNFASVGTVSKLDFLSEQN
jgi:hypothetical protein